MKKLIAKTKSYIILLLSAMVIVVWVLALGSRPVSNDISPVRIVIPNGSSARKIAEILNDKQLIRSPFVFLLTCRMTGCSSKFKPGVYEFKKTMGVPAVIRKLVQGESLESWITIPEGFTVRQIADLLAAKQLVDKDAFLRIALTHGENFPSYPFIIKPSMEGYLFPDTYLVARGTDCEGIIKKMLDTFEQKIVYNLASAIEYTINSRFGNQQIGSQEGMRKILVLASLVEREAKIPKDRQLIAAVLWNRLDKNMRLEIDATISYAPGESTDNKNRVCYTDLESDSPYNTYKHFGLPPGPICNPGLAAIKAVMNPAPVDYLFYVAKKDGSHLFSRTFEEHKAKKAAIKNGGQ